MEIQAVIFKKTLFSLKAAHDKLQSLGFRAIKPVHITEDYYRFRIRDPDDFVKGSFRTGELATRRKGIKVIYGRVRSASGRLARQ